MARYTGPVCRLCRREGHKLFLKSDRCYTDKCAMNKRSFPPGDHGQGRKKFTEYGQQLREKQKVKRFYGVSESQMRKYFVKADKTAGITGENLLRFLESRLDNVVYRMGFAGSRPEARQLVLHGHFTVDGKKVNIPSYQCTPGQEISVKEKSRKNGKFEDVVENKGNTVSWVSVDQENFKGQVVTEPVREEIDIPIEEHLIVELYSK
jgi:small subunit ribosomal protein S4